MARSAAVIESVEEKGLSRFISPSGIASETIRQENLHLKQELYDVVGLAVLGVLVFHVMYALFVLLGRVSGKKNRRPKQPDML